MEASIIEKTEKARFNVMLLQIISFGFWMAEGILIQFSFSKPVIIICSVMSAISGLLFCYATFKNLLLSREIKNNKELFYALSNEMYKSFDYKARTSGLFSTLISVILIYLLDDYIHLPVKTYCLILLFIAVITIGVHRLILYK